MSHLISASLKILDLEALRRAAAEHGGKLEQSKEFTSYTGTANPCAYRVVLPGVKYQVGIIKEADHYVLSHDPFGDDNISGLGHDGHKLVKAFGQNLGRLCQSYTAQVLKTKAKAKGWTCVSKQLSNGKLQLQMVKL